MNWPLLQNSLLLAGTTTALALGFGLIAALWLATLEARWRNVFLALAIVALALPPFLATNCWISLLGETGVLRAWLPLKIYSLGGTIWILALLLWPITSFAALAAWRRLEAAQFECEPAMTGWALLRWLLIPVAKGELALAAVLTFVLALNNFAVPAILQTKVLPDEMWVQFNTKFDTLAALKLSVPLVIAPVLLLAWATRRSVAWPRIQGTVSAGVFRRQFGSTWRIGCGALAVLLCAVSVGLPLGQIVFASRTWTELPGAIEASSSTIWNSFWFAALTATAVIGVALAISTGFSQRKDAKSAEKARRGKASLRLSAFSVSLRLSLAWLPFFIPGVLIGIVLIKAFNRPVLAAFYQSVGIVLLALAIRYFALAWTAAQHAVAGVDKDLTDAARLEGASQWQMFRFVVWPQIAPQMFAAWYVVYLLCLWDVESIVIIQPPGGETLALKIFNLLHYGHAAQVNALCLTLLGLAVLPLVIWCSSKWIANKTSKLQHPSSRETSSSKLQATAAHSGIGAWNLVLLWSLVLGVWCFCSGCSPSDSKHEAALPSQFFERAIAIGSRGVGIGEFNKPRSVACDTNGNVFVVDMTGRVQKFSPEGKFLLTWQLPETDLGKPKGMGRDHDGNILVIEPHYQRVNHFTPDGKLLAQWGCRGTNDGCFILPRGIAENSRGEFLVSEYMGSERVQRFGLKVLGLKSEVQSREVSSTTPLTPALSPSEGARGNTNWPYSKSDAPLVAQVSQSSERADLEIGAPGREATLLQVIGRAGTAPGEFNRAEGLCVDAQDRLYVADSCNHRIQIFAADGKFLREFGHAGTKLGQLSYPYDVAVDKAGNIFVCEFGNSRIQVFDANCQPVEIIGGAGSEPGQFNNPWAVALDARGNLYVADALNHRLQKLVRKSLKSEVSSLKSAMADARSGLLTLGFRLQTSDLRHN
jgi:ABC-type Fe3+ transport system permease subunit/DNA-binding beta-propeller fold protein YncE